MMIDLYDPNKLYGALDEMIKMFDSCTSEVYLIVLPDDIFTAFEMCLSSYHRELHMRLHLH